LIPKEEGTKAFLREMLRAKDTEPELVIAGSISIAGLLEFLDRPKECNFDILVCKETHPYLEGHMIKGKVVLPFIMAIEWGYRAAKAFRPEKLVLGVQNMRLKKGIILEYFDKRPARLRLRLTENEDKSLMASLLNEEGLVAYTARVEMGTLKPPLEVPGFEPFHKKPDIQPEDIYGKAIFHQKPFDAITEVDGIEESRAGGRLKGLMEAGWPMDEDWQTDPLILDGAMHLFWLWSLEHLGNGLLPVAIGLASFGLEGPIHGHARVFGDIKKKGGGLGATGNVWITDQKGQAIVVVRDSEGFTLPSSWQDLV
jgi:hypothetical protein